MVEINEKDFISSPVLRVDMISSLVDIREDITVYHLIEYLYQHIFVSINPPASFKVGDQESADPASKREEKIARYKRCKELDEKVAYLFLGQMVEQRGISEKSPLSCRKKQGFVKKVWKEM